MNKQLMPNPTATNPTIDAYVAAVKRGLKSYHVTPTKSGWAVKRADNSDADVFETKQAAVRYAQERAKHSKTELFVHNKEGLIQDRRSYASSSKRVAKVASKLLKKKATPKRVKSVAASALTQAPNKKRAAKKKK